MPPARRVLPWLPWSALILLLALWGVRAAAPGARTVRTPAAEAREGPGPRSPSGSWSAEPAVPDGARSPVAGATAPAETAQARADRGECALTLEFSDPGGDPLMVAAGTLRASWTGGARELELRAARTCELAHLPAARVTIEVAAEGLRHRAQTFELRAGDPAAVERVVLWPAAWIAVVVRDERGRPFTALAADRGIDPRRWFVAAFDVRAR